MEVRSPPPQKGISAILARYPLKTRQNACDTPLCDTISKRYWAIWGGISHWAAEFPISLLFGNYDHCLGRSSGGFLEGGFFNNRFLLKPDVAIASEVSILSKDSLAITDFHAKKMQHVQLFENPLPGTPPFAIPKL